MLNAEQKNTEGVLVIKRIIPAPIEEVFKAFTDASILQQWMGPGEVECVAAETNPQVGGSYRIHMRSKQGDHIAVGEYLEIIPNEKLVFSWSWETGSVKDTQVTAFFNAAGDETEIEFIHEKHPDQDSVEKHTEGWNECFNNLIAHF